MSNWHDELELALLELEDVKIDSNFMTFVISNILSEHGIFHQCRVGNVEDRHNGAITFPHCWIEMEQGWCVDLRLRQWLVDEDEIPHGVFQLSDYPRVRYQGTALLVPRFDREDLEVMTDDIYSKVKLSWLVKQSSYAV